MSMTALTGSRVRERRLVLGLRQADLARSAGISASYLNLIEHNRRRIGPEVLTRLAAALGVEAEALAEGSDGAMAADLRDAAAGATGAPPELNRIEDFTARFPGWAELSATQHRRIRQLERAVATLSDRLAQDPQLSASVHEVLSAASSVRATAAILAETEEIEPAWRARFHANLEADSARLARGAEALVAYLDDAGGPQDQGVAAPQEELEAWIAAQGWVLPGLEDGAGPEDRARIEAGVGALASGAARSLAQDWLARARADAKTLPSPELAAAVQRVGADPLHLARAFGADVLAVFRRLALLPGSAAGLVVCDASGTLVFRKPVEGFGYPRFGGACPLWPLYAALRRPGMPVAAVVEMAGRIPRRFRTLAWCRLHHPAGFAGPEVAEAAMLILPADAGLQGTVVPVGTSCRICPRSGCVARREPSILSEGA
jgi:XRE family transcriptional regulator, fatty acid utilization regulator